MLPCNAKQREFYELEEGVDFFAPFTDKELSEALHCDRSGSSLHVAIKVSMRLRSPLLQDVTRFLSSSIEISRSLT